MFYLVRERADPTVLEKPGINLSLNTSISFQVVKIGLFCFSCSRLCPGDSARVSFVKSAGNACV